MDPRPTVSNRMFERWRGMLEVVTELLEGSTCRVMRVCGSSELEVVLCGGPLAMLLDTGERIRLERGTGLFCEKVARERAVVDIPDAAADPEWQGGEDLARRLMCYFGVAVLWPDGTLYGIIDVVDRRPRAWSGTQKKLLEHFRISVEDHLAQIVAEDRCSQLNVELGVERDRLALAVAASGSGVWDYNIDNDVLHCDARWHAILGLDPATAAVKSIEDFKPHIHPDDMEAATEVRATLAELIANRQDYRVTFRIVRPDGEVRWLKSAACVIEAGPASPNRAVGAVVDITDRTLAAADLAASELRFKTLAETLPQLIFTALPDGTMDYQNRRWHGFTGVDAPVDVEAWQSLLHPDDRERTLAAWQHSLTTGKRFEIEHRYRHHSGDYRWLHTIALPSLQGDGRVMHWCGASADIHDAKLLQINREIVADELEHRIKNMFALAESLVGLSVRDHPDMQPFADDLRLRLASLGRAHSLIGPSGASHADNSLHDLIRALLEPYENRRDDQILLCGDDVRIDPGAATPLALIFHELATNAAKYGALSLPLGRLRITFLRDGDSLRITWAETHLEDSAGVSPPKHSGFGSKLLLRLVEGPLGGRLSRHWNAAGVVIELIFPARVLGGFGPARNRTRS